MTERSGKRDLAVKAVLSGLVIVFAILSVVLFFEADREHKRAIKAEREFWSYQTTLQGEDLDLEDAVFDVLDQQRESVGINDRLFSAERAKVLVCRGVDPSVAAELVGSIIPDVLRRRLGTGQLIVLLKAIESGDFTLDRAFVNGTVDLQNARLSTVRGL